MVWKAKGYGVNSVTLIFEIINLKNNYEIVISCTLCFSYLIRFNEYIITIYSIQKRTNAFNRF